MVQLDAGFSPDAQGAVANNFPDALARVESGGTIQVHGDVYIVDELVIDRPVTIKSTEGRVTIRGDAGTFNFGVSATEGSVVFKDLDFEPAPGSRAAVGALGAYGEVRIVDSNFRLPVVSSLDPTAVNAAVEAGDDASGNGRFVIDGGSVTGGRVGVYAWGGAAVDVRGTVFRDQALAGLQYQSGATGSVRQIDAADCGDLGCLRVFSGSVDLSDSRLSSNRTDVDWTLHHLVIYSDATGTVSGVHFDGCGYGQCFLAVRRADVTLTDNRFTAYRGQHTRFAIAVSDGTGGTEADFASRAAHIVATGNVTEGAGTAPSSDRTSRLAYAFEEGGVLVANGGHGTLRGNRIHDAYMGVEVMELGSRPAGSDGGVIEGRDNFVDLVWGAVGIFGSSQAFLNRNDLTDYVSPVEGNGWSEPSDLTCNWWGDAAGPQNVAAFVPASFYEPWATGSAVGTTGDCSGGA